MDTPLGMRRYALAGLSLAPFALAGWSSVAPTPKDPVAELQSKMSTGKALAYEPKRGYLDSVLKELGIDPASQTLVFSKTSLQSGFINSKNPRAIYFNADTYVGYIPGAPLIEIMTVHPKGNVMFYTIPNEKGSKAAFQTEEFECTRCHGGRGGFGTAELFALSSHTAPSGYPRVFSRAVNMTPRVPLAQRWGGWYVSGTHGKQRHLGNEPSVGTDEKNRIDVEKGANVTDLKRYFNPAPYPTPHSDIVALMVLEHQMDVQNTLSRTSLQAARLLKQGATDLSQTCEDLVELLLCSGEAKLSEPVKGSGGFAAVFTRTAPKDSKGRSLSDLDLKTRLLKFPLSPMVYSKSFIGMPQEAHAEVWRQIGEVLEGKDESGRFKHLSALDRAAIREIVVETIPDAKL